MLKLLIYLAIYKKFRIFTKKNMRIQYKFDERFGSLSVYYKKRNIGHILTSYTFAKKHNGDILLWDFNVEREYRRMGVGRKILKRIKRIYKDKNIFLEVMKENKIAYNLYVSEGFGLVEEKQRYYLMKYGNN